MSSLYRIPGWPALLAALACVLTGPLAAQPFVVDESTPAHGTAGVPLSSTVRFEFTDAVDQTSDLNTVVAFFPRQALTFSRVDLIPDTPERDCPSLPAGQTCPSVIQYTVQHEPDNDYTWLVYAPTTPQGKAMSAPYVLRYTTAGTIGTIEVSGSVGTAAAKTGATPEPAELARLVERLEAEGFGPVAARPTADEEAPYTLVLLVRSFSLLEATWSVQAATVLAGLEGAYTLDYVREGTYWPLAVRYADTARREIVALGFYDPDGNGDPDPLDVTADAPTGVTLSMTPFLLASAQDRLALARDAAAARAPDQRLIGLQAGNGARPAGTAYTWTYDFYAPSLDERTIVTVDPLSVTVRTRAATADVAALSPIPDSFLDSPDALTRLLQSGGEAFLEPYRPENISTVMQAGPLYTGDLGYSAWRVQLIASTSTQVRVFEGFVNMTSGTVSLVANTPAPESPTAATLAAPYPNPARTSVTIPFTLQHAAPVSVTVYDALGRRVATPLPPTLQPPGPHEVHWAPSALPAGLYLVRLSTGERVLTRPLRLLR
ncbi:hypothetical protein AWN76_008615 [Rhodothermaceae bacterium RA]|nr:hypothetical protein AWN76_008615 [Rhodothermaceae bacterium RA]